MLTRFAFLRLIAGGGVAAQVVGVGAFAKAPSNSSGADPVNARDFGARGDFSDDTAAIQAALNTGKVVSLPPALGGNGYRVTAPLYIESNGGGLVSDGALLFPDHSGDIIHARYSGDAKDGLLTGLTIRGIHIFHIGPLVTAGAGLRLENVQHYNVDMTIDECFGGVLIESGLNGRITLRGGGTSTWPARKPGSYVIKTKSADGRSQPPSAVKALACNLAGAANFYRDYGVLITSADGMQLIGGAAAFCGQSNFHVEPETDSAQITNVVVRGFDLDTTPGNNLHIVTKPSYSGKFGIFDFDIGYAYNSAKAMVLNCRNTDRIVVRCGNVYETDSHAIHLIKARDCTISGIGMRSLAAADGKASGIRVEDAQGWTVSDISYARGQETISSIVTVDHADADRFLISGYIATDGDAPEVSILSSGKTYTSSPVVFPRNG